MLNVKIGKDAHVDRDSVRQLNQWLKTLDADVNRQTKKSIKDGIGGVTKQMTEYINAQDPWPPMSGFAGGSGEWGWSNPVVKPSLTLSAGRGRPVAKITAQGKGNQKRMFAIAERAGSRSRGFDLRGIEMIDVLQERFPLVAGKGGRFAFRSFLKYRPVLVDRVQDGLKLLSKKYRYRWFQ